MNILLQTTAATWEAHQRNGAASSLIADGLHSLYEDARKETSTNVFEMEPALSSNNDSKTLKVITKLCNGVRKSLKASA